MDNSSRNIVKFIATITVAALLIMAARFYAQSQEEPMPAVAEEAAKAETLPVETTDDPLAEPADDGADPENPSEQIVEEDAELIMGEPSVNLENGGATVYLPQNPPPAEEAQVDQ
jgi:hypothetical protein